MIHALGRSLAFCPCLLVRWSSSSLVFQRHLLTTLISDLGLSTVHEKVSTGHLPRHVLGASFQGLSTVHRPPTRVCSGHLPRLVHRPPSKACLQATFPSLSAVHWPPTKTCPQATLGNDCPKATYQGLPQVT